MKKIILLLLLFINFTAFCSSLSNEKLEQKVQDIAHELRCPICQGLSVKESMNDISMNMKNKIRILLLEGKTRQEILVFFEERYGEWVLRTPKKTGLNVSLWLLPLLFISGAFLWIFFLLKKKYQ